MAQNLTLALLETSAIYLQYKQNNACWISKKASCSSALQGGGNAGSEGTGAAPFLRADSCLCLE